MIVIRRDQMKQLERAQLEDRILSHLNEFFPEECTSLGERRTRDMIRRGLERAESHGFTEGSALCRYVDIMIAFGSEFDREQPWAREILSDGTITDPDLRIDELSDAAMDSFYGDSTEDDFDSAEDDESEEFTA